MTTIHIFQAGEHNGVNAKHNGKWLNYDDAFTTLAAARRYALGLAQRLEASKIICDWNGETVSFDFDQVLA